MVVVVVVVVVAVMLLLRCCSFAVTLSAMCAQQLPKQVCVVLRLATAKDVGNYNVVDCDDCGDEATGDWRMLQRLTMSSFVRRTLHCPLGLGSFQFR